MIRVLLVSCGAAKLSTPAPARDLYTGSLFRAARGYAERVGAPWWILSAEHHLIHPETMIAPYERRLGGSDEERAWWARSVWDGLAFALSTGHGWRSGQAVAVEIHAGVAYTAPLMASPGLRRSWRVELPLAGLQVGERLGWYRRAREVQTEQLALPLGAA